MEALVLYETPFSELNAGGPDPLLQRKDMHVKTLFTKIGHSQSGINAYAPGR